MRAWHFWCQAQLHEFSFASGETMHVDRDGCTGFIQVIDQHQNRGFLLHPLGWEGLKHLGFACSSLLAECLLAGGCPACQGPSACSHPSVTGGISIL